MKKLFRKTWFALLLCLVGVVGSTLLNTRMKFGPMCEDARQALYVRGAGGILLTDELSDYCVCLDSLIELAERQGIDTASAVEANTALRAMLADRRPEAPALYAGYAAVLSETDRLTASLEALSLGTTDAGNLQRCLTSLERPRQSIGRFGYNADIDAFLSMYDRFPTRQLAGAVGLQYPERFA